MVYGAGDTIYPFTDPQEVLDDEEQGHHGHARCLAVRPSRAWARGKQVGVGGGRRDVAIATTWCRQEVPHAQSN
jgi:hypothetical protein